MVGYWDKILLVLCQVHTSPSSGYIKGMVLFSSCDAWPSWSSIDLLTLEGALIKYTLVSILISFFVYLILFPDLAQQLRILFMLFYGRQQGLRWAWVHWTEFLKEGFPSVLLLTVGIWVSSWGAVSSLSGTGTRKLGFQGVSCRPLIVKCHLHFQIWQ